MPVPEKINRKNLRQFCHTAGFAGVAGLCRKLKISRNTAYEAVTDPEKYPVAYPQIIKALNAQN